MANLKVKSPANLEQLNGAGVGVSAFAVLNPSSVAVSMGGFGITNLADGAAPGDAVNKGQLDAATGSASPLTTKGDIWVFGAADTRLPVGVDGQIILADSTQATGMRWGAAPAGYSDEQAQDAVGTILVDSSTIDFTYTDATPSITADVKDASLGAAKLTDAELTALAALVSAADKLPYFTGAGTAALATLTAFARTLLAAVDAAAARSTLGLGTAATSASGDFQPVDADLTALAALSTTGMVARTAANTFTTRTITGPAAGIAVTQGDGVAGNPTFALANDLAALEALAGTSTLYYRSGADTWSAVSFSGGIGFSGGTLSITDAELSALAGLVSAADSLPYFTGAGTAALATFTAFGRSLVDDADAATARSTLGLGTASTHPAADFQTADAELTALAGLASAADSAPYFTGSGTAALMTVTSFARTLLDDPDAATMRTTLGLGTAATQPSTAFQPADADLTAIAGLATAADRGIYFTGPGTAALFTQTAFARTLLDDPDAATMRATLGVGTGTVTSVSVVTANGFSGSVATSTSTPAITLTTTIAGMLKGVSGALVAATVNQDYAPGAHTTTNEIANFSTSTTSGTYRVDVSSASVTAQLPWASTLEGVQLDFYISNMDGANTHILTIQSAGTTDFIRGDDSNPTSATAVTLTYSGDFIALRSNGSDAWYVVYDHRAQPFAKVKNTTDQTILNTTVLYPVAFNSEDSDAYKMHDTVTNNSRITVKRPGVYRVKIVGHFDSGNLGTIRQVIVYKNGVAQTSGDHAASFPAGQKIVPWDDTFACVAGDYFEMGVYQDNGGSILLKAQFTRMSLEFIGG